MCFNIIHYLEEKVDVSVGSSSDIFVAIGTLASLCKQKQSLFLPIVAPIMDKVWYKRFSLVVFIYTLKII